MFILLTHNHIKRLEYQFYIHENFMYKYIMFTDTKKYPLLLDIKIEHISSLLQVVCFMDMPPTWFFVHRHDKSILNRITTVLRFFFYEANLIRDYLYCIYFHLFIFVCMIFIGKEFKNTLK